MKQRARFLFALLLMPFGLNAQYDDFIDAGELTFHAKEAAKEITIRSDNSEAAEIAKQAFAFHGAYALSGAPDAHFVFNIRQQTPRSVQLLIESGMPRQVLYQAEAHGESLEEAVLKACDLAVLKTSGKPGFFAGKFAFIGEHPQGASKEVYVANLLFTHIQQLTQDGSDSLTPHWSPRGDKILYTSYYHSGFPDIFEIDVKSGVRREFATYKGTNTGGAFSPRGDKVAMVLSSSGTPELYIADASGKNARRLTQSKGLKASPSWSHDGGRILLSSDELGGPQIYQIPARGGQLSRIPTNVSKYCAEPVWNPRDDRSFVFTAAVAGTFQLALYNFDKNESRFITQGSADNLEPQWLSDGRHLVFTRRTPNKRSLYIMDTETGKTTPLSRSVFGNASEAAFVYVN